MEGHQNTLAPNTQIPLEDELGDVLEKAISCAGVSLDDLAAKARVPVSAIRDAIDYRPELGPAECGRLAAALGLNEVGLCALASGKYPIPESDGLPFRVWPLRMPYGIGVVNAYAVTGEAGETLLFDTGPGGGALLSVWPASIHGVEAVFVTHLEPEHAGGLHDAIERLGAAKAFVPAGALADAARPMAEGDTYVAGSLQVTAFRTPGHCAMHNCYHVRSPALPGSRSLLVSGDLVFAGSAGGPYHCHRQLRAHLQRVLAAVPADTVLAPGHGPMSTTGNELRFNPFVS